MKRLLAISFAFLVTSIGVIAPKPALAASQDECAIWLCLPAGFGPAECSGPHDAMMDRLEDSKSPLPSFSSCADDGGEGMSSSTGYGARLHAFRKCVSWDVKHGGHNDGDVRCGSHVSVPEEIVDGTTCGAIDHSYDPSKSRYTQHRTCTTLQSISVVVDGRQAGEPYYFRKIDTGLIRVN